MIRKLFTDKRGSIAIMACLCLAPILTFTAVAIQVTSSLTRQTRLVQAQISAAYAIAKEGRHATAEERNALMRSYIAENLRALRAGEDTVISRRVPIGDDKERIISQYKQRPIFEDLLDNAFPSFKEDRVIAERTYKPLELVIVIDGSVSSIGVHDLLKQSVANVIDEVFAVDSESTHISLLAYSGYVNIGWEYKDKLITPESRRIYSKAQRATARQYGFTDLLDPAGPEGVREGACVLRPAPLPRKGTSRAMIQRYVDNIEVPPSSPDQGFTLLMNDGRPVTSDSSNYAATRQTHGFLTEGIAAYSARPSAGPYYVRNGDIRDIATVPKEYVVGSEAHDHNKYTLWGRTHSKFLKIDPTKGVQGWGELLADDSVIHVPFDCPPMPMLVASQSKEELLERMDSFRPMWTTGVDEGLAWAMRMLSPNWRDIWERGDYPADYHSGTEKRILLIGGSMTTGYFYESNNAIAEMCDRLRKNGIDLYILVDESEHPNLRSIEIFKDCAGENYTLAPSVASFPEVMPKLVKRSLRARLAPS